jgi:hypothetical protein
MPQSTLTEKENSMLKISFAALLIVAFLIGLPVAAAKKPLPQLKPPQKQLLSEYLKQHWMTPEEYVVSKFKDHDIVFVGEYHRIKHDVQLIQDVIPLLYKAGVRNLGIEFGANEFQKQVDQLISAEDYDDNLVRSIMFEWTYFWGYKEYQDIYRAAWRFNRSLPPGSPKFRVVNLKYKVRFDLQKEEGGVHSKQERMTKDDWAKVFCKGDEDEFMAGVIQNEFLAKNEKALIYSGMHHAFTRYQQPIYDFQKKKLYKLNANRMGNLVYAKIGDRAFNIFLHSPWGPKTAEWTNENADYPVGGVIDRFMLGFKDTRVGFDVKGTPFGQLRDDGTYYSIAHNDFKLEDFCDGYIYQRHLSDYEGCTVDPKFINEANFQDLLKDLTPNPDLQKRVKRPSDMTENMRRSADIRKRFRDLN